jgi:hypothetical protein
MWITGAVDFVDPREAPVRAKNKAAGVAGRFYSPVGPAGDRSVFMDDWPRAFKEGLKERPSSTVWILGLSGDYACDEAHSGTPNSGGKRCAAGFQPSSAANRERAWHP